MSTTTRRETEIVADPDLPKVTITREFDAPPEKVFRAWVDPELFVQWIGPNSIGTTLERWDAHTGGGYRYVATQGGEEVAAFFGSFHEIRPSERIVQTFTWEGMPDGVSLETMTFEELPGGRTRTTAVSIVDSMEAQAAMMASGMDVGINEGYAKLDRLLAEV